jgi:hypothetical protein
LTLVFEQDAWPNLIKRKALRLPRVSDVERIRPTGRTSEYPKQKDTLLLCKR